MSQLISVGCLLFAYPNITDLLQREQPEILAGMGVGYRNIASRRQLNELFIYRLYSVRDMTLPA